MESVPEPRPSEWDKRLSTHSPFRTLNINGQIPTGEGVSTLFTWPIMRISEISVFYIHILYLRESLELKFSFGVSLVHCSFKAFLIKHWFFFKLFGPPSLIKGARATSRWLGSENSICSCMLLASVCLQIDHKPTELYVQTVPSRTREYTKFSKVKIRKE